MSSDPNYEECPPKADAMIQSMRAVGYDFGMAVADLIDNSITAGANNIWIEHHWDKDNTHLIILDDGSGMSNEELYNAMRLGSTNPTHLRQPNDLGRFGMGLKTASFSQCKLLTVGTKKDSIVSTRCWDLDVVDREEEWLLKKEPYPSTKKLLNGLEKLNSGTTVVWEKLDRLLDKVETDEKSLDSFLERIESLFSYLGMIFHRYLEKPSGIKIYIGSGQENYHEVKPWDPYLRNHSATRELSNEAHTIFGNYVNVRPFVLPHISKLEGRDHQKAAGPKGWNAQQGIYLYRKERLIIAGGWLGLGYKQEDHYKLARIMVDIPNSMDHEWHIDVKKATAKLPDIFRGKLKRLAKITREKASEAYRYRGKYGARKHSTTNKFVWKKSSSRGKTKYQIDKKHPIIEELLSELSDNRQSVNRLLKLIESTVPIETIIITNAENPDSHSRDKYSLNSTDFPVKEWFIDRVEIEKLKGLSTKEAFDKTLSIEPFSDYPELIALIENYD